jgi:hypothetical protein
MKNKEKHLLKDQWLKKVKDQLNQQKNLQNQSLIICSMISSFQEASWQNLYLPFLINLVQIPEVGKY